MKPNLDPNASMTSTVYAASIASMILSGLFFAGRLMSKKIQRLPAKPSEFVLFLSLCCCWGVNGVNVWMGTAGLGKHLALLEKEDPDLSRIKLMIKIFILDEMFYYIGLAAVKISILLFYREIFRGRRFTLITNILMGIAAAWCISNVIPSIFSCRPISGFWNPYMTPAPVCINKAIFYVAGSIVNILTDIAILCLPIQKILCLQLDRRTKIVLIFVFLLGGLVCFISIYRFTILFATDSPDFTWYFTKFLNWTAIELAMAIASACLPTMRPLLLACMPSCCLGSRSKNDHTAPWPRKTLQSTSHAFSFTQRSKSRTASSVIKIPASTYRSSVTSSAFNDAYNDNYSGRTLRSELRIIVTRTFELATVSKTPSIEREFQSTR